MDIAGTKKKIQRLSKVAEESYKKMNTMMEQLQGLQDDMETTSRQVDHMEYDLAEQRAIIEAIAAEQDLDVETVLADADLPDPPSEDGADAAADESDRAKQATSRPSASDE